MTRSLPLLALACLLTACSSGIRDGDIKLLTSTQGLNSLIERDRERGLMVVDVRSPDAYARAHLPGAVNLPLTEIYPGNPMLSNAHRIVVYGDGWADGQRDHLSWAAASKLLTLGYKNVYEYGGGLRLWRVDGGPIEGEEADTDAPGGTGG